MPIQPSAEISAATVPEQESHASTSSAPVESVDSIPPSAESSSDERAVVEALEAAPAQTSEPDTSRVSDPPATKPESPSARIAVATKIDTSSVAPVTRDAGPDLDFGDDADDHHDFFSKSLEEVHAEEVKKELAVHEELSPTPVRRRRLPDRRARSIVVGVLGVCALIGATAMVRKATSATRTHAPSTEMVAAQAAQPATPTPAIAMVVAPTPAADPASTTPPEPATTTTEPALAAAPSEAKPEATVEAKPEATVEAKIAEPAPTPAVTAAPAVATATAAAPSATNAEAPTEDPDAALSAGQLLAAARTAINGNNASRAATLAKKAIAKGAGGSAHYVLGAAYQLMGANIGAKNEYRACAKSGAAEASECAALVESM